MFDHLKLEIKAQIVEFRRSLNLHFRGKIDSSLSEIDQN
jgi:hypothetical protein